MTIHRRFCRTHHTPFHHPFLPQARDTRERELAEASPAGEEEESGGLVAQRVALERELAAAEARTHTTHTHTHTHTLTRAHPRAPGLALHRECRDFEEGVRPALWSYSRPSRRRSAGETRRRPEATCPAGLPARLQGPRTAGRPHSGCSGCSSSWRPRLPPSRTRLRRRRRGMCLGGGSESGGGDRPLLTHAHRALHFEECRGALSWPGVCSCLTVEPGVARVAEPCPTPPRVGLWRGSPDLTLT